MANPSVTAIRSAVASGQFVLAERLWKDYAGRLDEELKRGMLTRDALEEAGELVKWSRLMVLCWRARRQASLGGLRIAGAYGGAQRDITPCLFQTRG